MSGQASRTSEKKLTAKQAVFVREYLIDLNATQAAIRAGYSAKTAGAIGDENLKKPEIATAIQLAMDARAERTDITADRVLAEIAKVGFSDIRKMFEDDGRLKHITMLDDDTAAFVSSVKVVAMKGQKPDEENPHYEIENTLEIKMWDKLGALEKLGKHLKLFTDKVEHSVTGDLADILAQRRSQVASINGQ